jgi:flagellar biosynthetic protein FliQ
MDVSRVMDVLKEGVAVAMKLGGPMLVLSMIVGVVVAIGQAVTQIHEQTISFVFKLLVVIAVLLIGGSWMLGTLQDYTRELYGIIAGQAVG